MKIYFVTGTDTGIGKTIATWVLGEGLMKQGFRVGVLKPVQCGGDDAAFLRRKLKLSCDLKQINPLYLSEPLSPHLALSRASKRWEKSCWQQAIRFWQERVDVLLVEGAGGLLVPIEKKYRMADLINEMKASVILVTSTRLGTLNHTLLTLNEIDRRGLPLAGLVINHPYRQPKLAEDLNKTAITQLSSTPVLGIIPFIDRRKALPWSQLTWALQSWTNKRGRI